jgi:methionine synthase II (cobalamin-independent)
MECDDARSGGFEPLRFVPKGKIVVLGLVTTKSGELETEDQLKARIDDARQFVDLDQLGLSPPAARRDRGAVRNTRSQ